MHFCPSMVFGYVYSPMKSHWDNAEDQKVSVVEQKNGTKGERTYWGLLIKTNPPVVVVAKQLRHFISWYFRELELLNLMRKAHNLIHKIEHHQFVPHYWVFQKTLKRRYERSYPIIMHVEIASLAKIQSISFHWNLFKLVGYFLLIIYLNVDCWKSLHKFWWFGGKGIKLLVFNLVVLFYSPQYIDRNYACVALHSWKI